MFLTLFLTITLVEVSIPHGKQPCHDLYKRKKSAYFKQKAFTSVLCFFHRLNDKNFLLGEKMSNYNLTIKGEQVCMDGKTIFGSK